MKKLILFLTLSLLAVPATFAKVHNDGGHTTMAMWFDIPVINMDRAIQFYNKAFAIEMQKMKEMENMAFFPKGGSLIQEEKMKPSVDGTVVYLDGGNDLQTVLDRVEPAGGTVILKKTLISPEIGYFAMFIDSEGNKIGLYSPN